MNNNKLKDINEKLDNKDTKPSNERYWQCNYCDRTYNSQAALLWHENTFCKYEKKLYNKKFNKK